MKIPVLYLALAGVRNLRRYLDPIPDDDVTAALAKADSLAEYTSDRRRSDIRFLRTPRRWPWRTSTSQRAPGLVGGVR